MYERERKIETDTQRQRTESIMETRNESKPFLHLTH